jgi:hypothetical protein
MFLKVNHPERSAFFRLDAVVSCEVTGQGDNLTAELFFGPDVPELRLDGENARRVCDWLTKAATISCSIDEEEVTT